MALTDETRERLRFILPKVGVPRDVTDWIDQVPGAERLNVGETEPTEEQYMAARQLLLDAGIPAVYFAATVEGIDASTFEDELDDPPPGTLWYIGATA